MENSSAARSPINYLARAPFGRCLMLVHASAGVPVQQCHVRLVPGPDPARLLDSHSEKYRCHIWRLLRRGTGLLLCFHLPCSCHKHLEESWSAAHVQRLLLLHVMSTGQAAGVLIAINTGLLTSLYLAAMASGQLKSACECPEASVTKLAQQLRIMLHPGGQLQLHCACGECTVHCFGSPGLHSPHIQYLSDKQPSQCWPQLRSHPCKHTGAHSSWVPKRDSHVL